MADSDDLRAGERLPFAGSPKLEDDLSFRGIRIAAPAEIVIVPDDPGALSIPVAGGYHLDLRALDLKGRFDPYFTLLAHAPAVGALIVRPVFEELGEPTEEAEPDGDPGPGSIIEYFNLDLAELGVPAAPATWFVTVFLGPYVSNVARVVLREAAP